MKRLLTIGAFGLFGVASLSAQNAAVTGFCVQGGVTAATSGMQSSNYLQGIIPSCTVTVYVTGTTTVATIYADRIGTPLGNPFTATTTGQWLFWAASSSGFDVVLSGGTTPNIYLTPVTLTGVSPASSGAPLNPWIFGCTPNSTATADMTANVTCLNTIGNLFNRAYLPAGVWNINACLNFSNNGGFVLEGAGVAGTSIIQNTSNTCAIKVNAHFPNEFRIADMTIGHSVAQSPAASESVNSTAPAIFFTGPSGASIFNFSLRDLAFTKSSRGVELDKTIGGTSWGYDISGIRCNGDLTGACINLAGTNAGNPRISMHRIYNTAIPTTEPFLSISQGEEVGIDDIEDTPSATPASTPITAYSTSGSTVTLTAANNYVAGQIVQTAVTVGPTYLNGNSYTVLSTGLSSTQFAVTQAGGGSGSATGTSILLPWRVSMDLSGSVDGTVDNFHIENKVIGISGQPLVTAENGNLRFSNISAAITFCPAPYACNLAGSVGLDFLSNIAGGGNITAHGVIFYASTFLGQPPGSLYGMRYNSNASAPECDNFLASAVPPSYTTGCVDPSSDQGRLAKNQGQYSSIASAGAAASWAITSVATSSGGAAVYTGTFTGCSNLANQRALVAGFVATAANNGFFHVKSCTATTLTAVNGSAVSETHAATAVVGIGSVGMPSYARFWTGAASQLVTCNPLVQPIYNPASTLWDTYLLNFCSNTQTSSQLWTQHAGWDMVWTEPGNNNQELTVNNVGLSGLWRRGGLSPSDSNGSIPVMRGWRNLGGSFTAGDLRIMADGAGHSLPGLCTASNTSFAIGSEAMQADQACGFMVGYQGDWYNQNGIATPIIPHTVTGSTGGGTLVSLVPAPEAFGSNVLTSGVSATISNAAACAPSATCVYKLTNCGINASTALGIYGVTNVSAGVSFKITAFTAGAVTIQTGDASTICWQVN